MRTRNNRQFAHMCDLTTIDRSNLRGKECLDSDCFAVKRTEFDLKSSSVLVCHDDSPDISCLEVLFRQILG